MELKNKKTIIPERLREARVARGMAIKELADKINVSRQAVYQFELGIIFPKAEVFNEITKVLNFPKVFFTLNRKLKNNDLRSPIFFRSLRSATRVSRGMIKCRVDWAEDALNYLQKFIDFPKINIEDFLKIGEEINNNDNRIEEIANNLRQYWNLGDSPINNLTNILIRFHIFMRIDDLLNRKD